MTSNAAMSTLSHSASQHPARDTVARLLLCLLPLCFANQTPVIGHAAGRQAAQGCVVNSGSVANITPCIGAPGTRIIINLTRSLTSPPDKLVFKAVLARGVPAEVIAQVQQNNGAYGVAAPIQLCATGTGGRWDVFLVDQSGQAQGEIGQFMVDCRAGVVPTNPGTSPSGAGNLLVNGGFEIGPVPGDFITLQPGSTAIAGWTVTRASIDYIGTIFRSCRGNRCLDLDGTPGFGGIKQTFATRPGTRYLVTFDMAGNMAAGPTIKAMEVAAAGQSRVFTYDITGTSNLNLQWVTHLWTFTAAGPRTTIEFFSRDTSGGYTGPVLDNVVVTALQSTTTPVTTQGLLSGVYTGSAQNQGLIYPTTWTLRVSGNHLSGSSEWTCCPGHRIDPLTGTIQGDHLAIMRDCSGSGQVGDCRQVFLGSILGTTMRGTWSGTGGSGTWTMARNG